LSGVFGTLNSEILDNCPIGIIP